MKEKKKNGTNELLLHVKKESDKTKEIRQNTAQSQQLQLISFSYEVTCSLLVILCFMTDAKILIIKVAISSYKVVLKKNCRNFITHIFSSHCNHTTNTSRWRLEANNRVVQ